MNFSRRVKRPERETAHLNPSSAEVKNAWSYTSSVTHIFIAWCLLTTAPLRKYDATSCEEETGYSGVANSKTYVVMMKYCGREGYSAPDRRKALQHNEERVWMHMKVWEFMRH